ncbi:hypothetical protein [Adhaeribacter rhizoryzae]|uniref:Uncharacterized protein n=1 Tax=Adhaeribacter rhizoryzae TaxID=2607907 RepID=A0A5M6DAK5_9BACT|nr:hypothetical protein [Adhaeribacter rhizoryzae]KAA5543556.1 hypothetical protein F0145_16705 [Adhaeribacter rhizoryzae]
MKKQILLGMVTLLVAVPGFSQIKAEDKKDFPFMSQNINQLPYAKYQGWQPASDLYQPKGFQGVLLPKAQYEKPTWLKPEALPHHMPQFKPQNNQKIRVVKPDSAIRYH